MVRFSRVQQPNPARKALYDARYARYQQILAALDGIW
jgi:hypothetical protein